MFKLYNKLYSVAFPIVLFGFDLSRYQLLFLLHYALFDHLPRKLLGVTRDNWIQKEKLRRAKLPPESAIDDRFPSPRVECFEESVARRRTRLMYC